MEANVKKLKLMLKKVLGIFGRNWLVLVLSFVCAVVLWGIILKNENPERIKRIDGIKVSLEGEADLRSRQLVVVGDRSVVFPEIEVEVSIDLLRYAKLSASDIIATASLRQISAEGEYEININADSSFGSVVDITPDKVKVTVDKLNTKKIPVEVVTENKLPDGYIGQGHDLSHKEIEIEGANSVISDIVKAVYMIDLSEVKSSINESVSLTLMNVDNEPVSQNEIYGEIPSVHITMEVFPYKDVGFDVTSCLVGREHIHQNYEIVGAYTEPETVRIISDNKDILDDIKALALEKIDVSGAKKTIETTASFTLPEGVLLADDTGDEHEVKVFVVINERQVTKPFESVTIVLRGENDKYVYTFKGKAEADVIIKCGVAAANRLKMKDIVLYVDVADLESREDAYELPISYDIDIDDEIYVEILPETISLVVSDK